MDNKKCSNHWIVISIGIICFVLVVIPILVMFKIKNKTEKLRDPKRNLTLNVLNIYIYKFMLMEMLSVFTTNLYLMIG